MNELVTIKKNDIFTNSLIVAEGTDNQHHAVRVLIQKYQNQFEELGKLSFEMRPLESGQQLKLYELNEPQATFLMTLLRNSEKVVKFKLKLTKEFYKMRTALMERTSTEWLQTRKQGKLIRRDQTDSIAELIEYAKGQGSKNADKMYLTYTKLANKAVGIQAGQREFVSFKVLTTIGMIEDMVLNVVREEMQNGTYYKEIYQKCKAKTNAIVELAYLPEQRLLA